MILPFNSILNLKVIAEKNVKDNCCMYHATVSFLNKSHSTTKLGQNNQTRSHLTESLLSKLEALFL